MSGTGFILISSTLNLLKSPTSPNNKSSVVFDFVAPPVNAFPGFASENSRG